MNTAAKVVIGLGVLVLIIGIILFATTGDDFEYDNEKEIYLFNLNKRYDLDGDFKFNTARLINHSCNPNCEVLEDNKQL